MNAAAGVKRLIAFAPVKVRRHEELDTRGDLRVDLYHWANWYTDNGTFVFRPNWQTYVHQTRLAELLAKAKPRHY